MARGHVYLIALLAAGAVLGEARRAIGWWDKGHAIIAAVAADRLTPRARAAVKDILKNDPTGHTLVAVSAWADTVRKTAMPETYNWHFVDIPLSAQPPAYDAARDCRPTPAGDCIIAALDRQVAVLTDKNESPTDRAEALKFITHLVGDLHQPLHCAERDHDAGGNAVKVTFLGATHEPAPFQGLWNLHAVWDGGMVDKTGLGRPAYAQRLRNWIAIHDVAAIEAGTFIDWAEETHREAVNHAYRTANGADAFPTTDGTVGLEYQVANIGVVDQQLARAAVRLAKVLNDAFP